MSGTNDRNGRPGMVLAAALRDLLKSDDAPFGLRAAWSQARGSLAALVPGIAGLPDGSPNCRRLFLVSAGTTPWVAWPFALNALAAGWEVELKDSLANPSAGPLLRDLLERSAPHWAARLHCVGTDHAAVAGGVARADAVVVYGSDQTVETIRLMASGREFLGFPHAVSFAVWHAENVVESRGLLTDTLVYGQAGCLSPLACFVLGSADDANRLADGLASEADRVCRRLDIVPTRDPGVALRIREWRDTQAALGAKIYGDVSLRWSIAATSGEFAPAWDCVGGLLPLIPVPSLAELERYCVGMTRRISGIAVSGNREFRRAVGKVFPSAHRVVSPGFLQRPSLNWRNGGVDPQRWFERMRSMG